jgi:hypothetical protein
MVRSTLVTKSMGVQNCHHICPLGAGMAGGEKRSVLLAASDSSPPPSWIQRVGELTCWGRLTCCCCCLPAGPQGGRREGSSSCRWWGAGAPVAGGRGEEKCVLPPLLEVPPTCHSLLSGGRPLVLYTTTHQNEVHTA